MNLNRYIDQTLLKADATEEDIIKMCQEADRYKFASVCVNPNFVKLVKSSLQDSEVSTCSVIGFPLGANTTDTKIFEAREAIKDGADELDYVINIAHVKGEHFDKIEEEMRTFISLKDESPSLIIKVILENCYLTNEEIQKVCEIAKECNIDFVKTSTGFGSGGATLQDIRLMRQTVGENIGVKASGGVRTYVDAISMIEAGATRIGASSGVKIVSKKALN